MNKFLFLLFSIILLASLLRIIKVSENPPGLYIDEVAIGYNAYQITKTGTDEHGKKFPLFFKSFGDYKMPVYVYSTSLSMLAFGKTEFAVRFTSILSGILIVLLVYLIIRKILILDKTFSSRIIETISLVSAFLTAISSWYIHFSRGGFEANQALFLFLLSVFLAISYLEKKKIIYLIIFSITLALSIYTYHSYRIIAPIFFLGFSLILFFKDKSSRKQIVSGFFIFSILCLPIFLFSFSGNGSARFSATSVFSELPQMSFAHKLIEYPFAVFKNYLSYYSFYFLFDTGDGIGRHQIPEFGLFYKWQLPFLLIGIYFLLKSKANRLKLLVFSLLIISPIPASLAVPSPHSLRSLLLGIPLIVLISLGIVFVFQRLGKVRVYLAVVLIVVASFEFIFYSHYYYVHYPRVNSRDWGAGYKEIVLNSEKIGKDYDYIVVDKNLNFAQIYYKFYAPQMNPLSVDVTWGKPKDWEDKKVLYVRPYYGPQYSEGIIFNVFLDKENNEDIISQFWKL